MENVRYKHAVSYFVIIAEIETIDDSVDRKQTWPQLTNSSIVNFQFVIVCNSPK